MSHHSRTHALYRFYDADDQLLYVGITLDPGPRWRAHRDDKPWWHEVTNVTIEVLPSRAAVLEAEKQAILAERPRYNVVHNRGTSTAPRPVPQLDRLQPFQAGDWVALGLANGRCPVGEIAAVDETWISLRLKDFWQGTITARAIAVRWDDVRRVEIAYPEDTRAADPEEDLAGARRVMNDQHLGDFQTAWERHHLGGSKDPIDAGIADARRERNREER